MDQAMENAPVTRCYEKREELLTQSQPFPLAAVNPLNQIPAILENP